MTTADFLRRIAADLRRQADDLDRLAAESEISPGDPSRGLLDPRDILTTRTAEVFSGLSRSQLARLADQHPQIGWKLGSGTRRYSRKALQNYLNGG